MSSKRRKFSAQFKAEAVQMVLETGDRSLRSPVICRSMRAPWVTGSTPGEHRTPNPNPDSPLWSVPECQRWEMRSAGCGWITSS